MSKNLPTKIDPKRLAFQGSQLTGEITLKLMSRLLDSLHDGEGKVFIDWLFWLDDKQRPAVEGVLQAELFLVCQRCLQPMPWTIDTSIAWVFLNQQEPSFEEETPAGYEPLSLINSQVSLITLIEDELILNLPIVARHTTCPTNEYQVSSMDEDKNEDKSLRENPFQVLSKLKW